MILSCRLRVTGSWSRRLEGEESDLRRDERVEVATPAELRGWYDFRHLLLRLDVAGLKL